MLTGNAVIFLDTEMGVYFVYSSAYSSQGANHVSIINTVYGNNVCCWSHSCGDRQWCEVTPDCRGIKRYPVSLFALLE
jgi:hypothetical protein